MDRTNNTKQFHNNIQSYKISNLILTCEKYLIPDVLCPWGCSEYIHQCGYIELDILIQHFLPKLYLTLSNYHRQCKFVETSRDDIICPVKSYNKWLFNKCWCVKPSICFVNESGSMVSTCRNHNRGTQKIYIHPSCQSNYILPSKSGNQ